MEIFTGVLGLVLAVLLIALGVYWILFPWFVYSKMDRMLKHLAAMEASMKESAAGLKAMRLSLSEQKEVATAPPPVPGEERFYIHLNNETVGPFPIAHIQDSFKRGRLQPDTLVLQEGEKEWKKFDQVFEKET